jgi:REP element-mobilizing transposase RayT
VNQRQAAVNSAWPPTLTLPTPAVSVDRQVESPANPGCHVLTIGDDKCTFVHMRGMHLIFSTYGFWLPNDPRGSGSTRVRAQHIYEAGGEATKVHTTYSVANRPHDMRLRRAAKEALKYPAVESTGMQARAVGRGIAAICPKVGLVVHACAILPDHVHVVVAAHRLGGDEVIECLKRASTRGMNKEGLHPLQAFPRANGRLPSPWAGGGWKVYLDTPAEMRSRIRYVEQNPVRAGFPPQRWSFVVPYMGSAKRR